jgi:hypothetical protein
VPGDNVLVPFKVTVTALPGRIGLAEKETDVPIGFPVADKVIALLKPPDTIVTNVVDMVAGAGQVATEAPGVEKE